MKRILITGVDGFVGRNLVDAWMHRFDLIGIDLPADLFSAENGTLVKWHHSINQADLREDSAYYEFLLADVDIVIHCAARTRINASWTEYADYYNTNIVSSHRLFNAAQKHGVKKFIYFSSSSVYGNGIEGASKETDRLQPTNPYAVSKAAAEMALTAQTIKGNTELVIVRPFTMYGEHMNYGKYSLAIAKFLSMAEQNLPLIIDGTGKQRRDFVHVSDAIQALELIMEHGKNGDIYNIGTGQTVSVQELADTVSRRQIRVPDRIGAVDITCADITRLQQLGYQPTIKVVDWLTARVKELIIKQ
jgi:nucleoside-diphosphate-sugar epimerase